MKRWRAGIACLCLGWALPPLVWAQDEPVPEVIGRYQQMLERSPAEGAALEKVVQYFQDHGGLQKLDEWWAAKGAQEGEDSRAVYSLLRGILAERRNQTEAAGKFYEEATRQGPGNFRTWLAWGDFQARQGKLAGAVESYQKALGLELPMQDRPALYRKLGASQQRNMDAAGAKATWLKMADEFPKDSFALDEAAAALMEAENFEEAGKIYQKLVEATEANSMARVQALVKVAELQDRQGKTKEAIQGYEAILPLTSTGSWMNREIRARIEQVYRRQDDLAGLAKYYEGWLEQQPKDVEATLRLSTALGELDQKTEALTALKKAAAMAPDRRDVEALLARSLIDAKQYDEAIRILKSLTASDPEDNRYWLWLGEAYWFRTDPATAEDRAAALASWKKTAPATVKNVGPVLQLAEILQGYGLTEEALAEYKRALELAPDAPEARLRCVEYLRQLKRDGEAEQILAGMVEGTRATPANYLRLASTLKRLEKPDEARTMVDRGLELEPGNFDLLSLSWTLYAEEKKWPEALALFDQLTAASPNVYFVEQIEVRHLQALASAGKMEEVTKTLRDRLGGQPPLNEGELRLLARLLMQQEALADFDKAMVEAGQRFPASSSLLRLEAQQKRKTGDLEACVAALQKLVSVAPAQKNDWLTDLARVRMEQGRTEESLQVVQQMIDANPAQASGYLLFADLALGAQRQDEAIEKLKQAVKMSDNGNEIRMRLARLYMERGENRQAREMYDAAFEAAGTPQDRLTLIKPMAEAYFLDGKLDDLVTLFKQRQAAEEGGWRYGLYLAEIFQQMQDYGSARKELAKSLVQRPNDPALLRQLIALAEKENDLSEQIKYREQLAALDASPQFQIALADAYNSAGRFKDAWTVLQKNAGPLGKDPQAWRMVLRSLAVTDFKEKVQQLLEESLGQQGNEQQAQVTLAEFWLGQGETESAAKILWKVVGRPLPLETLAQAPPTSVTSLSRGRSALYGIMGVSDYSRRVQRGYEYLSDGQQLMAGMSGSPRGRATRVLVGATTVKPANTAADYRDRALVYLAAIALKENKTEAFVAEMDRQLAEGRWEPADRVVAYAMVQAREPLWQALEAVAADPASSQELDLFAYSSLFSFALGERGDEEKRKRIPQLQNLLAERLVKRDPDLGPGLALSGVQLAMYSDVDRGDRAQILKLVDQVLAKMDRSNPEQLLSGLQLVLINKNYDRALELLALLEKQDLKKSSPLVLQQLQWLPNYVLSASRSQPHPDPVDKKEEAKIPGLLIRLLKLRYPATQPTAALGGMMAGRSSAYYGEGQFPPPNRYINDAGRQSLQQIFQGLKTSGNLEPFLAELDREQKAATDWKAIYPALNRIYIQWWDGKKDEAVKGARALLAAHPSDDFRLLLASMLGQQQKYAEAIRELEAVSAKYGPDFVLTQQQLLRTAKLAKDTETAKKAALRLVSLRLTPQDRAMLISDLRELGLTDKANELGKQIVKQSGGTSTNNYDADRLLFDQLAKSAQAQDKEKVASLARQVLGRDPMSNEQGMGEGLRSQALESLKTTDQLKAYLGSLEEDVLKTPDSMRLNLAVAEAMMLTEDKAWLRHRAEYPLWLKMKREGSLLTGFWSRDGKEWQVAGKTSLELPVQIYVGLALSNGSGKESAVAHWDEVKVEGKVTGPWKGFELGENQGWPGSFKEEGGSFRVVSTKGDFKGKQDGAYFVHQILEGDGEIQGRIKNMESLSGKGEPEDWTKAALEIRSSLEAGSMQVLLAGTPRRGISMQQRVEANGENSSIANISTYQLPLWMRIQRKGNDITLSQSRDGKEWQELRKFRVSFGDDPVFAGVVVGTNRNAEKVKAVWENLQATPAAAAVEGPRPEGLPQPWLTQDLRGGVTAGSSTWEAERVVVQSPVDPGKNSLIHFLYQPLPKEGEISGRLTQLEDSENAGWTSLALFGRLEAEPTRVQMTYTPKQDLVAEYRVDLKTEVLPYLRKAASLAPKDAQIQLRLARYMQSRGANEEALQIYTRMLQRDFGAALEQQGSELMQAFDKAGRLDDFFRMMDAWTPPPMNPMTGGGNFGYVFLNQGEQLEQRGPAMIPYALRLYRKGREIDSFRNAQLDSKIVGLLRKQEQNEEAARETLAYFQNKPPERSKGALGLQNVSYNQPGMRLNFGSDGTIYCEEMDMLSHAQELGVFPKVKEIFAEKMAQNPSDFETLSRLVLLQIMSRDKAYAEGLKKLQEINPQLFFQNGICGVYVQELARWRGEAPQVLKLAAEMKKSSPANIYQAQTVNWQIARLPRSMGDTTFNPAAVEALKEIAASLVEQSTLPNRMDASSVLRCLNYMVSMGMAQDVVKLIEQVQDTQEFRSNSSLKKQLDQYRDDVEFRKGKINEALVTFFVSPGKGTEGADIIEWELTSKQQPGTVRMLPGKVRATGMELVLLTAAGKEPGVPFKTISNPELYGSIQVKLPAATRWVSMILRKAGSQDSKSDTVLAVSRGKNLIRNPLMKVEDKKGQPPVIEGWQGVFPFAVEPEKIGPWNKMPAFSVRSGRNGSREMLGEAVPVQPGSVLVQSFWVRSEGSYQVGRRYLNARGEEIRKSYANTSGSFQRSLWGGTQQVLSFDSMPNRSYETIPPGTVAVQPILQINGTCDLAGMSLQVLEPEKATGEDKAAPGPGEKKAPR